MHALIFDLDGTLVDTVYQHTLSWQRALAEENIDTDAARLHRRIGMAGDLLMKESARETGRKMTRAQMTSVAAREAELFARLVPKPKPLEGAHFAAEVATTQDPAWDCFIGRKTGYSACTHCSETSGEIHRRGRNECEAS